MRLCAHAFMVSVAFLPMGVHALAHWRAHMRLLVGGSPFVARLEGGEEGSPEVARCATVRLRSLCAPLLRRPRFDAVMFRCRC